MERQDRLRLLVGRAREGDRQAFDTLVEEHRERLASRISARLGITLRGYLELEDALQETFTRAFEAIDRFHWRGEGSFLGWLATIAERVILEASRKQKRGTLLELVREPPESASWPSKALRRTERFERLEKALATLSSDHRKVLTLALIDGLQVKHIAERLNRSRDAVRKLLSRALEKLKCSFGDTSSLRLPDRALGEKGGDHGDRR